MPTMGALHEGHLSLVRAARQEKKSVIVSIFVNPTQFGPTEDYSRYPRQLDQDLSLCLAEGVDAVFCPNPEEMYPLGTVSVNVRGVSERWEGQFRPGHFSGVATVVAKLFIMVSPSAAYFGLKDFQQCAVVQALVRDMGFPIELRLLETVRESDGLALSSRNTYLSPKAREAAPQIYREISCLAQQLRCYSGRQSDLVNEAKLQLERSGFEVDYLVVVDGETLEPTESFVPGSRILVCARLDGVRLLDNVGF